ncbi:MAG: Cof-type HAD-IIB family hydrolase [Sporomusaceae bacterium]|nr:Cof-type HAD-IIB family hydrolase [Sporomusaceae bacterium]
MPKIRLVAIDLDGTLLQENLTVSPRTIAALQSAVAKDVVVTIATGRMFASAVIFAKQIGLDVPLITYNGALIQSALSGEVLYHQPIPSPIAKEILTLFQDKGWYIQAYADDKLYVDQLNAIAKTYASRVKVEAVAIGKDLYRLAKAPTKLLGMVGEQQVASVIDELHRLYPGEIYATSSQPGYVEIMHAAVNKGAALDFLAKRFSISQEEVMALGDSLNDTDMISFAGWGVAMGNGASAVKAIAQAVTDTNDNDGVAKAIEKYVLDL